MRPKCWRPLVSRTTRASSPWPLSTPTAHHTHEHLKREPLQSVIALGATIGTSGTWSWPLGGGQLEAVYKLRQLPDPSVIPLHVCTYRCGVTYAVRPPVPVSCVHGHTFVCGHARVHTWERFASKVGQWVACWWKRRTGIFDAFISARAAKLINQHFFLFFFCFFFLTPVTSYDP